MSVTTQDKFLAGIPVPFSPGAIEKELGALWEGTEPHPEGGPSKAVTRLTLGNVLWLGASPDIPDFRKRVPGLVTRYPCRLFVLEFDEKLTTAAFESYVNAQCYLPVPGREQVCCEEIHFRFGAAAMQHLRGCVLPLLLPDVFTSLWFAPPAPGWESLLPPMIDLCDWAVTEVARHPNPARSLQQMASAREEVIALEWIRLAPLREQIAMAFDDHVTRPLIPTITGIDVEWAGLDLSPVMALKASLLVGWMALRIGWQLPAGLHDGAFEFESPSGPVAIRMKGDNTKSAVSCFTLFEIRFRDGRSIRFQLRPDGTLCRTFTGDSSGLLPITMRGSELAEPDALGLAFSSRATARFFRDAACLAAPLLGWALARK